MDSPDLEQLMNFDKGAYVQQLDIERGRAEMLREAACSLGARGGLSKRSEEIRVRLETYAPEFDAVYSFQSVMLEFGVLPPVIISSTDQVKQESDFKVEYSGKVYSMVADAKFVTSAPTWRSYVFKGLEVGGVEPPPPSFLPKDDKEKILWKSEVARCWKLGVSQANEIAEYNRNELKRDFAGMLRYKLLALKGEIQAPVVVTQSTPSERIKGEKRTDRRTYIIKEGASF
ncbi:hypothetical protein CL689_03615 [Candidatus Saccharibacteria bacterium]|nr:hypothetical protein [Candidatus Saccharibacteria bacterium]|tara:strand:- start:3304 stop:3993 length:690 start_codon:yes stop_codon:yes gene_type:complete